MIYRKLIALVLGCLLLAAMLLGSSTPIVPAGKCADLPCTQAHQACVAQEEFEYNSCMQLENDGPKCLERSGRIYNGCMAAHGCPIIN